MKQEHEHSNDPASSAATEASAPAQMSRRKALAVLGKHAAYTAPAVLAVLSVTKASDARADIKPPIGSNN